MAAQFFASKLMRVLLMRSSPRPTLPRSTCIQSETVAAAESVLVACPTDGTSPLHTRTVTHEAGAMPHPFIVSNPFVGVASSCGVSTQTLGGVIDEGPWGFEGVQDGGVRYKMGG
ncbi:hypothetical protein HaLaN_20386 [Haematococcus lacustris]|uniref:Uncharacterized protein n=1 Tax=Haematococcus lacustris TaxID=44745 RepID=A0A699ZW07_HAELA|nr:hypothetical protein HaLaN_20386 [Haematococcus lacustris]